MKRFLFVATLIVALLLSLGGTNTPIVSADPPGFNGDVKVHDGNGEPDPIQKDEPKVCTFHLHAFGFDGGATMRWNIKTQPGGTQVMYGEVTTSSSGQARTGHITVLPEGMYKLSWDQKDAPGAEKHKVFKIECEPEVTPSPTTPVPSPTTPVPSPTTPVPSPTTPVPSPTTPVPSPTTPVPSPTTPVPSPTTPVPSPNICTTSYVKVVIYGGWGGIPVRSWVGGTEQPLTYSAVEVGESQVTLIYWPPVGTTWSVRVQPQTPPGKNSSEWTYKLVSPSDVISIERCKNYIIIFQLISTPTTATPVAPTATPVPPTATPPKATPVPPTQVPPVLPKTGGPLLPIEPVGLTGLFALLGGLALRRWSR